MKLYGRMKIHRLTPLLQMMVLLVLGIFYQVRNGAISLEMTMKVLIHTVTNVQMQQVKFLLVNQEAEMSTNGFIPQPAPLEFHTKQMMMIMIITVSTQTSLTV